MPFNTRKANAVIRTRKGLLLDRDGVLIENRSDYVKSIDEISLIPSVPEAVARLWENDYEICVVTNQAGVGKGLYSIATVQAIHQFIENELQRYGKGKIYWYFCPHRSEEGCSCRKPKPGMLMKASTEHDFKPEWTWMVGDNKRDIEAGKSIKCKTALVLTGLGKQQTFESNEQPDWVVSDLNAFVEKLLKEER